MSEHPLFTGAESVGMITGENPVHAAAAGGHEGLKRELQQLGARFDETEGRYGGKPERSLLVYGLPREHLFALGQKYGQEAVIHSENGKRQFMYTNGPKVGQMHVGDGADQHWAEGSQAPADDYTRVPGHGHVRLGFDWANSHAAAPPPVHQPTPAAMPVTKHEIGHGLYKTLRAAAHNLGATDMSDPVKKSQRSQDVAENKKSSVPEALHGLYKTLKDKVVAFENDCLALRKAELAKDESADAPSQGMMMAEDKKLDAYAKTEKKDEPPKPDPMDMDQAVHDCGNKNCFLAGKKLKKGQSCSMEKSDHDALCKCGSCSKMEKYAKGEMPMAKAGGPVTLGPRSMAARTKFGDRTMADQQAKLPAARASAGNLMDGMLAGGPKPLAPGQPLTITPIASNPLKPITARGDVSGGPAHSLVAKGPVQSLVERAASKMVAPSTAGLTPPPAGARPGAMSPILARHLAGIPQHKSELPAGAAPDAPGPKGEGKLPGKPELLNGDNKNNGGIGKAEIKKAGAMPTAPKAPGAAGATGGAKPPKVPGAAASGMPKLPKPAKPATPKVPAMGAGTPALKNEK